MGWSWSVILGDVANCGHGNVVSVITIIALPVLDLVWEMEQE